MYKAQNMAYAPKTAFPCTNESSLSDMTIFFELRIRVLGKKPKEKDNLDFYENLVVC